MLPAYSLIMRTEDISDTLGDAANKTIKEAGKFFETVEGYLPKVLEFGIKIVLAIVILIAGKVIIGFIMKFLNKVFEKGRMEISVKKFLLSLARALLYFVLIIIICNQVGIDTTSFIALLGTAGLALGLALQGSLSNFAGGVLILLLRPFSVGDYIIDAGSGKEGTVEKIDLFYTYLYTPDNRSVIIPNGNLTNSTITNVSSQDKRRVDIEAGISYNANMADAKRVIETLMEKDERILHDEPNAVVIKELAASQVTVLMRAWVRTENYWDVYFDMTEKIKDAFDKAGIEIPYNQLDVHVHRDKSEEKEK
ncbi:MAG: mechanosensitive ion channel [Lachnospiraceae bacterium]